MKINIFTSYYARMAKRKKSPTDCYIQVSRTCYCPLKDLEGVPVQNQIDYRFPDLGDYLFLDTYEEDKKEDIEVFADFLKAENWELEGATEETEVNIFLLCFENLKSKWTKKDEEKFYNVKANEYKFCHRTVLAEILNKKYGFNITEYDS